MIDANMTSLKMRISRSRSGRHHSVRGVMALLYRWFGYLLVPILMYSCTWSLVYIVNSVTPAATKKDPTETKSVTSFPFIFTTIATTTNNRLSSDALRQQLTYDVQICVNDHYAEYRLTKNHSRSSFYHLEACFHNAVRIAHAAPNPRSALFKTPIKFPHIRHYEFQNGESVCGNAEGKAVFVVISRPESSRRRLEIRSGDLGKFPKVSKAGSVLIFYLTQTGSEFESTDLQQEINAESSTYGDIVQLRFTDGSDLKHIEAGAFLDWLRTRCALAETVFQLCSDDVDLSTKQMQSFTVKVRSYTKRHSGVMIAFWKDTDPLNQKSLYDIIHRFPKSTPFSNLTKHVSATDSKTGGVDLLAYPLSTLHLLHGAALRYPIAWPSELTILRTLSQKLSIPVLPLDYPKEGSSRKRIYF